MRAWALVFLLAGCARLQVNLTAPLLMRGMQAMAAESDVEVGRAAAPAQLKLAEGLLQSAPDQPVLLELLARGWLEYAFGFMEDALESTPEKETELRQAQVQRSTALYERALGYARRLLDGRERGFSQALASPRDALAAAIARYGRRSAPGLLYAGMALASTVNLNRLMPSRGLDLPKAIVLLERAHALDPRQYFSGAAMTLGLIFGTEPKSLGGDPARSTRYFEEAIAATGGRYLMARVMYARTYAVAVKDRALFESTLKAVLDTSADVLPGAVLPNALARRRAARYLARAPDSV